MDPHNAIRLALVGSIGATAALFTGSSQQATAKAIAVWIGSAISLICGAGSSVTRSWWRLGTTSLFGWWTCARWAWSLSTAT
jgi:hypothetical protein